MFHSRTVQNEMGGALGRMTIGAAGKTFDSANSAVQRYLTEGCVRYSDDKSRRQASLHRRQVRTTSVTRKHKFLSGYSGYLCVEEF